MALVIGGRVTADPYARPEAGEPLPAEGALLVTLDQWQESRKALLNRDAPVGVQLASDQHPEVLAGDVERLSLIALEFPTFRDGRAYSYARILRDRYKYTGELRAVGDVLADQLLYMQRVGFDAFELEGDDAAETFNQAINEFGVVYQASGDDRVPALRLRHAAR
jgi:uncharacterized protein (DUF934 family)